MKKVPALSTPNFKGVLTILMVLISTISFAQQTSPQGRTAKIGSSYVTATPAKPAFGVRAGILSSGIRGEASSNLDDLLEFADGMITTNNHTGFYGGAYVSVPVGAGISIEPGVFYSQKGYELTGELTIKGAGFLGANAKAKLQSEYVDIPVLLKADLGGGLQIFAGPQFSYLMKANLNSTAGLLGINLLNSKMDVTEQFNRWDAAITGGIGYKLSNGINITASYDYGLSKLDKNQNTKAYNTALRLGVGIQL